MSISKKLVDLYFNATLAKTNVISKGQNIFTRYSTGSVADILPAYTKYKYKPGTIAIDTRMSKHIFGALVQYDIYRGDAGSGFKIYNLKVSLLLRKWAGGIAKKTSYAVLTFKNDMAEVSINNCVIHTEEAVVKDIKYIRMILEFIGSNDDVWTIDLYNLLYWYKTDTVRTNINITMYELK